MTVIQRYRHIPVVGPEPGADAFTNYRDLDRAALAKKALVQVYGPRDVEQDPVYMAAVLFSDLQAFMSSLGRSPSDLGSTARMIRGDHSLRGAQQQAILDAAAGE